MQFLRPEALAALHRWRDAIAGLALIALGGFWAGGGRGVLAYLGVALLVPGAALVISGIRRARFLGARQGQGPGIVLVDEGEITYMGPLSGGTVALAELDRLVLDPSGRPSHWVLERDGHPALHIPVNADGAEQLLDAFVLLPGLRTGRMLEKMAEGPGYPTVIWQRETARRPGLPLH